MSDSTTKKAALASAIALAALVLAVVFGSRTPVPPAAPAPVVRKPAPAPRPQPGPARRDPSPAPAPRVAPPAAPGEPVVERDEHGALSLLRTSQGREWRFERDEAGRPVAVEGPGGRTTLERDASGRVVARVDAAGVRNVVRYDYAGRPIGFEAGEVEETLRYDGSGRLTEARAGLERLTISFDEGDDRVAHVRAEDHAAGVVIDYRSASRRQEARSRFGTTTWTQDELNRLARLDTPAGAFTWTYDEAAHAVTRTAPNGVSTRFSWDVAARAERVSVTGPRSSVLEQARVRGESGLVEAIERDGVRSRFGYDAAGQLVTLEVHDGATRQLAYDGDGNRVADGALAFEHDALGRLTRASDGRRFQHDAAGRLVRVDGPGGTDSFGYDGFGRLITVQRAGRPRVSYGYDGLGRIVTRDVDGARTRFVHDGPRLLAELGPGAHRRVYVYGPGLDEPLAYRDGDGPWTFLHADAMGHVLAYSDERGVRVDSAELDPWGVPLRAPAAADRPVFFAGRHVDPLTGLVHLRARFYDPALGRFLTPDPVGLLGGTNAYAYVGNDPLGKVDPLGLSEDPPEWLRYLVRNLTSSLPEGARESVASAALLTWSLMDGETRQRLQEPPRWEIHGAAIGRKVNDIVRGYEPTSKEYLFLKGEVIGLARGIEKMVQAIPELANFAVDLGATVIALTHDLVADQSWAETLEFKSGLSHIVARGDGHKLVTDALLMAPERIAEASRRTAILTEEGRYQEAGEVFGEVVLMEAATWIMLATSLANKGLDLARLSAADRQALIRQALSTGYRPGVGGQALDDLAAFARERLNRSRAKPPAPAPAAAPAPTPAAAPAAPRTPQDGLVQVLDPDAPRGSVGGTGQGGGAAADSPKAAPAPEPAPAAPAARAPGEAGPKRQATGDANRPRGPPAEKTKSRGQPEEQLTDKGRNQPSPLTARELDKVTRWQGVRNRLLKKWRERAIESYPPETQRLLRGSADNALRDSMTPDDAAAVLKENRGVDILKPDGTKFNHMDECLSARDSLSNTVTEIRARLQRLQESGRAAPGEVEALRERLTDLSRALDEYPRPAKPRAEIEAERARRHAEAAAKRAGQGG